jgi:hypothetical protein
VKDWVTRLPIRRWPIPGRCEFDTRYDSPRWVVADPSVSSSSEVTASLVEDNAARQIDIELTIERLLPGPSQVSDESR